MARYGEDYETPTRMNQQRDLVLSVNEFCFVQNKTDGRIRSHVGPITITISQQETLVTFNTRTKRFEETSNFEVARQLFTSAPEGWYVILKNPAATYPEAGKANTTPSSMTIGKKVNIPGPVSFALYPGQMTKTIRGHKLRSNQYLLARVYDANAARENSKTATVVDNEGKEVSLQTTDYFVGQQLVIKGTEVSFYIPPTGIEVIPIEGTQTYVRDAITLERLEYAILKDEDGEKRYVHGPAVVFPKPTETFVTAPKGGNIFRALELSPISGIYVKVIAEYTENEIVHPVGEELFITGNDQMIYYPRPEHAMIQYDGKYMHHAIAIPEGEGRYILNRLTGDIKTVTGPKMYLPDPRYEVVVKRKLSARECALMYPGNMEVLAYNTDLSEKAVEKLARKGGTNSINDAINNAYSTSNQESALAIFEATSNISRGVSYTKPRTITLDTKYDGVVNINVWNGYAVSVVSKTGKHDVVVGPAARMLDYDETLEAISLSTGCPKNHNKLFDTAYLRIDNNRVSDVIVAQTKDFVDVQIKLSYSVSFLPAFKDKWFSIENYVKYLCEQERNLIKREVKKYTIQEFYSKATDIVRNIAIGYSNDTNAERGERQYNGRLFKENGMLVQDAEITTVAIEDKIAIALDKHQNDMITEGLRLTYAEAKAETQKELAKFENEAAALKHESAKYKAELEQKLALDRLNQQAEREAKEKAIAQVRTQAEVDMQALLDKINEAELERTKKIDDAKLEAEKQLAEIEKDRQAAYAETVKTIMESVSADLVAAMTSNANADMLTAVTKAMAPYAIAKGESVAEVTNKLLRGTSLEGVIESIGTFNTQD